MKTFKDILNEVAEPSGYDEKRFKAKHVIQKINHPIDAEAQENQFKGRTTKDTSKKASYHDGEDEEVYEEVEHLDELSKGRVADYLGKSFRQANTLQKHSLSYQPKSVEKASTAAFKRRQSGIKAANRRLDKDTAKKIWTDAQEQYIDEAVKPGSMKLKDGSVVTLTKEDASYMNNLFQELNSSNQRKMESEMMASKSGFDKILTFAREAGE